MSGDIVPLNDAYDLSDTERDALRFLNKIGALPTNSALNALSSTTSDLTKAEGIDAFSCYNGSLPFEVIYHSGFSLIQQRHIATLKEASFRTYPSERVESPFDEEFLLYLANAELKYTVEVAVSVDPYNKNYSSDAKAFNEAYQQLVSVIDSIENPLLKAAVELPTEYKHGIDTSFLLNFGQTSVGAKRKWRRDRFYFSVLTIYLAFSGQNPSGTKGNSPTLRFMSKLVDLLGETLNRFDEKTEDFAKLSQLWRLPSSQDFLHEWFKKAGGAPAIQKSVSLSLKQHLLRYHSRSAPHIDAP